MPRSHRGATAEEWSSRSKSTQAWPRPRSGNLEIWGPGNPEVWDPKHKNINKNLKTQVRSAQNVGKGWISRITILLAPFGAIPGHFLHVPKKSKQKKCTTFCLFSLVGQWALFTRFGVMCWCHKQFWGHEGFGNGREPDGSFLTYYKPMLSHTDAFQANIYGFGANYYPRCFGMFGNIFLDLS